MRWGTERVALVAALVWMMPHGIAEARQAGSDAQYQEARRLFESLDYENAVKTLDQLIAALQAAPPTDATSRERLASAYEMRARSRFGLGNPEQAKADFISLLRVNPNHALTGQVSPRVVTLFEETAAATVTNLALEVVPATARVAVDGVPLPSAGPVRITAGDHEITAEERGYRSARETFSAKPGETTTLRLTLERISAVINVLTSVPDIDVMVDGVKAGRTVAQPSGPASLALTDIATGVHTIELTRECYVRVANKLTVDKPDDYTLGPVDMQPAVATLSVTANEPGAQIFIDGRERGVAPFTATDLCEGSHLVEIRTKFGRDARRVESKAGDKISVEGVLKPTFALVSLSGETANADIDLRLSVERALAATQTLRVLAPPADESEKLLKANQLPASWLANDAEGKPMGASTQMARPARSDAATKLADALGAQGVASITALDRNRMIVSLLAAGSGTPDILDLRLDRPDSIASAIERLDRVPAFTRPSLGLLAIDVADVSGAVIVAVDGNGPANGRVQVGDVFTSVAGEPVADTATLARIVSTRQPGQPLVVELRDAKGAAKKAELDVFLTPRLIGLSDQTVLANRSLVDLRARLSAATDPFQQSIIRLNTAVVLARLGDCRAARDELKQVQLPDRPGVGNGTVQYLIGVCAEELGSRAEAEAAFKAAAASDNLLTEDGPSVKELAEARLAQLLRGGQ